MKNIKILALIISLTIFAVLAAACGGGNDTLAIKAGTAVQQKIEAVQEVTGVLVPAQSVDVQSKVSGQVTAVNFAVGSPVKKGDILLTLETKTLNGQLEQAKASLASALAAQKTAAGQAEQARINLAAAQNNYDRNKELYDSDAVSQSELETAQDKLDIAKSQYQAAQEGAKSQSQAAVEVAQAAVDNIQSQIAEAAVKSPIDGIVTNKNISIGEIASPGKVLVTVIDNATLKLKATVPQESLPFLSPGQQIQMTVDIYPDQVFSGKVDSIAPMSVSTGLYFPIEISMNNSGGLQAGLSAHAMIDMVSESGVVVPSSAVREDNGQSYVFVIKDNVAIKTLVTTGLKNDEQTQILQGLKAGDAVAITNINNLFDNMAVTVKS